MNRISHSQLDIVAPARRFGRVSGPAKLQIQIEIEVDADVNINKLDSAVNSNLTTRFADSALAIVNGAPKGENIQSRSFERCDAEILRLRNRLRSIESDFQTLKEENVKLQATVDGVDNALKSVYGNSTRVKEMRKNRRIK